MLLVFRREFRDQLRDRRTLFMIGVLPLLLYPIIGMAFMQLAQFMRNNASRVLIVSHEDHFGEPPLVVDGRLAGLVEHDARRVQVTMRLVDEWHLGTDDLAAQQWIENGQLDVVVYFPPNFHRRIRELRPIISQVDNLREETGRELDASAEDRDSVKVPAPAIFYSEAKDRSRIAYERVEAALLGWRRAIVEQTLTRNGIALEAVQPFDIGKRDISRPVIRQTAIWSKILPFVIVIWAMTGAFYPAVDLCAGEKERGTLETLLCSPAERLEIVWGKLLTVMLFSMSTALLNLTCMAMTSTFISSQFREMMSADTLQVMGMPPLSSYLWLLLALIPISALFSALALALATMARSTKEGQYYLMPLLLLTMPLLMVPLLPSVELDLGTSLLPVSGIVLLLRQLMEHDFQRVALYFAPVTAVTAVCCWTAMRWAVDQFNNESVLFRDCEIINLQAWARQLVRDRTPTPSVAQAWLCAIAIILIRFFVGMSTPAPTDWGSFASTASITLIALVLVPAILMAVALTTRPVLTLLLRGTSLYAILGAALLAFAMHPLAILLLAIARSVYPLDDAILLPFQEVVNQAPSWLSLLMVLALLPAVCEEFAFRGFILSGLRHMGNKWRAIVLSAALFGIAHGIIQQSIVASAFGIVLGFLAVQTGSIWPAITFHAAHNALAVLSPRWLERWMMPNHDLQVWVQTVDLGGEPCLIYSPLLMLAGLLLSALLLRWFQQLPTERSSEERLLDALDNQPQEPAMA